MMNLENLYGTQETLLKVFERAVQRNNPKDVFFQLSRIYVKSEKHDVSCIKFALKSRIIIFTFALQHTRKIIWLFEVQ